MCNPGTTQAYFVLEALNKVGANVSSVELKSSVNSLAAQHGFASIEDVGPYKFGYLLHDFSMGRMIRRAPNDGWNITEKGRGLKGVLREFVEESHPDFVDS